MKSMLCVLVHTLLSSPLIAGQNQFFRDELFPEQLQQQELQVQTQHLQDQLQELNIQWQQNPSHQDDFLTQQAALLHQLQDTQRVQQELQNRLQLRLTNTPLDDFHPTIDFVLTTTSTTSESPQVPSLQDRQQQGFFNAPLSATDLLGAPPQGSFSSSSSSSSSGNGFSSSSSFSSSFSQPVFLEVIPPCQTQTGEQGLCKPLTQCVTFYADVPELRRQPCQLNEAEFGVCCPLRKRVPPPRQQNQNGVLRAPPPPNVVIPPFTQRELNNAGNVGLQKLQERLSFIAQLFANHIVIQDHTPASWHLQFFQTSNDTLAEGDVAQKTVEASVNLVNDFQLSPDQGRFALPAFSVLNTVIADTCPPRDACRSEKYRTPDGSCNNLVNSRWGMSGTALQRILPPKYEDGVNAPRNRLTTGQELPSARLISTVFATESSAPHDNLTLLVMQWGQFLDHDLTHTPITRGQSGSGITCCKDGNIIPPNSRHPDCFPIALSRNDHIFAPFGERCMEFVRSLPAPRPECNFGPREQMNQVTGYHDGSNIYGSNQKAQRELREFRGGRLRIQNVQGRQMLPNNADECANEVGQACFKAGDTRVNEQVNLAVMHTLWLREHNRVAAELAKLNPQWSDEALFQEARRIVVAEMQHITYNEFLPILLGREYMDKFELTAKDEPHSRLYDENLNAGITNVFATAAFRFGHSLVASLLQGLNRFGRLKENLVMHQHHFSPFVLYNQGAMDDFIRGLSTQSSEKFDRHFSKELTDHLFQGDLDFGLDLFALNIQRGRDHGIPPYNEWREVCGLQKVTSWEDLANHMDADSINTLRRIYPTVEEVDLFAAAMAETPKGSALLGPTFLCLVGDQFSRLRRGDRFFYEEGGQPSSFSPEQTLQLKKSNLARILCDNSDDVALMQPLAFFRPSVVNQRVDCRSESILRVDLRPWQNEAAQA